MLPLAPNETFTRSQLAAILLIFMGFQGFHKIVWISTISVQCQKACCHVCRRDAAPKESFTRFQLADIIDSSIHRSIDAGGAGWLAGLGWAGWLAGLGWLAGWLLGG